MFYKIGPRRNRVILVAWVHTKQQHEGVLSWGLGYGEGGHFMKPKKFFSEIGWHRLPAFSVAYTLPVQYYHTL